MRVALASLVAAALAAVGFSTAASGHPSRTHSLGVTQLGQAFGRQPSKRDATGRVVVPTRLTAGSQQFTDPTGDAINDAPDITTIDVANDDAGTISMTISFANRFSDLKDNDGFEIVMDTDQNASTGAGGFDYVYVGIKDRNGLFVWNGSGFAAANASSVRGTSGGGKVGMTVNRADLGNATVIRFWVQTTRDFGATWGDEAPNGNFVYVYTLNLGAPPPTTTTTTTTPPPPTATAPPPTTTTPAPTPRFVVAAVGTPHPGKRFLVRVRVALGALSAPPGTLGCTARVGTAPLRTAVQRGPTPFKTCVLAIPVRTAGKTLVIVLKIHYRTTDATRTLRFRIS